MNRLPRTLYRQQLVVLLLMTCFALSMSAPTTPILNLKTTESVDDVSKPIIDSLPSTEVTTIDNEMMKTSLEMTTTNGNLIGAKSQPESATVEYDNGTIKIHEPRESVESSLPSTSQMPPTVKSDLSASVVNNENKSIFDAVIELPIKSDAENPKFIDSPTEKKGKMKKASIGSEKKQKLKQKFEQNPGETTKATVPTTTETYEATISTSIKTAPTTIKSTTLTTIKSFQLETVTTTPVSALNSNEMQPTTLPSATAGEQQQHDNVIVLNANGSGLIVVDIMENFGVENSTSNTTETFEIKMDLIDDVTTVNSVETSRKDDDKNQKKDDIFLTTIETPSSIDSGSNSSKIDSPTTTNDDIILINVNTEPTSTEETTTGKIKWNQLKTDGNIKINFDNIDLPNQNVNVSIENGELVIDSIDISVLNKAEEELRKKKLELGATEGEKLNKTDSLEIILIEDDSHQDEKEINRDNLVENDESNLTTAVNDEGEKKINDGDEHSTTIASTKYDHLKKIELGEGQGDGIKIKTTDKDSDTIFYISNTEVKVIESIPTASPNASPDKKYFPAIYEEDVIVDVPNKNRTTGTSLDKYEEDIVLSPLTSDFDPKDINYIGEAFLDVEESQNGVGISENHHIIPLTSDVVIQPVQLRDSPPVGIPIIGELPPQIELEEMVFSDDYDSSKQQQSNFRVEEYFPNFLSNRLVKNTLDVDVPKELILDARNITLSPNRTHISVNTMINGTNMTTIPNSFPNATALLLDADESETADLYDIQTLLLACFATLMLLILCVIIALTIRCCWRKYHRQDSSGNDMMSDKSTDPLAEKTAPSADELKSTESGMTLDRGGNMQASTELLLAANGDITPTNHNGTNGSIITMTLKNNHLIVETEERNDISRDTRETKMHYSPSEKDGVFIVEAARGADQNGSHKPSPLQQKPTEAPLVIPEEIKIDTLQSHFTPSSPEEEHKQPKPEQVEVHTPPAEVEEQKAPEAVICNGTKTGLSQSDLSLTSSNSSNQNYSYGDKDTYQFEEKGYKGSSPKRIINVHCHDLKPLIENSPPVGDNNKPVITSAVLKNGSPENGEIPDVIPPPKDEDIEKAKIHKINGIIKNGLDEIITVPDENCNDAIISPYTNGCNGELDSLSYLPAPPEELSNDQTILELTSMDSLPPPPPEMTEVGQS